MHCAKKLIAAGIAATLVAATAGCTETSQGGGDADEVSDIELVVSNFHTANSAESALLHWWLDQVEERTDGRVSFERYDQEALCPGSENIECARDGRADIVSSVPAYTAGFFQIGEIMSIPFQSENPEAISRAFTEWSKEYPEVQEEVEAHGIRTLYLQGIDVAVVGAKKPIRNMADLKGLAIRSVGPGSEAAILAADGNPVAISGNEIYEGVRFGTIDVWINNLSGAGPLKFFEVSDHWAQTGLGVYTYNGVFINHETWTSLPQEVQEIMDEVTTDLLTGDGFGVFADVLEESCDTVVESGQLVEWVVWDDANVDEWRTAVGNGPARAWMDQVKGKIADPESAYARFLEILEETEAESSFVSPAVACAQRVTSR